MARRAFSYRTDPAGSESRTSPAYDATFRGTGVTFAPFGLTAAGRMDAIGVKFDKFAGAA